MLYGLVTVSDFEVLHAFPAIVKLIGIKFFQNRLCSYSIRTVCFVAQRTNRELKERKYLLQDVMNSNGEFDASPDKTHLSDTTISKAFVLTPACAMNFWYEFGALKYHLPVAIFDVSVLVT